ncbi:MAG: HDOD domain-containing protein [Phycisphaeraceae bacterium]
MSTISAPSPAAGEQTDRARFDRIELILRQIDTLPTLPAIAVKLLDLTSSDDTHASQVGSLIEADPALTAKLLSLCRSADRGVREDVLTVSRAVVLLGFSAVRNAVLSVKVFEMFDATARGDGDGASTGAADDPRRFDRTAFWSHSLAVGILAELIAAAHPGHHDLPADEAFVCGLLHDVGKLALDHVLPKSFSRVVELCELNQGNIAEYERRVLGLDHHTAGKRLAQQWGLAHKLQDCIWLHGASWDTLPRLEHRRMIGLVSLADMLARQQHVGYSGNFSHPAHIDELIARLELNPNAVADAGKRVHEELERRGLALGLQDAPSRELFLASIQRANAALGRVNTMLEQRGRVAATQGRLLEAINAFHAAATPGRSVQDVQDGVAESARTVFGAGFYAMLYPGDVTGAAAGDVWTVSQYGSDARPVRSQCVEAPPYAPDLTQLDAQQPVGMSLMGLLPWIADYLVDAADLRQVKLLPLSCGWGTAAVLLHDRPNLPAWNQLAPLASTWGAAIAAAGQHDGARRLGEQLAEANAALAEAQDRLLRQESMARLGEMAAGAAHEMNNPLAVISGRSQLLAMTLDPNTDQQKAAQTIHREAHRLSDLITGLRLLADPPQPNRRPVDMGKVIDSAIKKAQAQAGRGKDKPHVSLRFRHELPVMRVDPDQVRQAICELLVNAIQASPRSAVAVVAQREPGDEAVIVQVIDDGEGMDKHTLDHAMDPFFSAKAAGRQVGMGLARAQQLIRSHGGSLELRSEPGKGTTATVMLPCQ